MNGFVFTFLFILYTFFSRKIENQHDDMNANYAMLGILVGYVHEC